jgi:putative aldouronate transport system substrate-binding protein
MKKQFLTFVLLSTLVTSVVFANGAKETQAAGSGTAANQKTMSDSVGEYTLPISASPVEYTIFDNFNNIVFDPDWEIWKEFTNRTNVSLKSVISQSNSNEQESYNLMLSSGKLADVISLSSTSDLEKLGRDGGLIPLNDLIKEYAPHIQHLLDTDDAFRTTAVSLDGNIYFIPKNLTLEFSKFYWLRMDWMDELGLEVPTTLDELHDVLYAFRNEDPNKNGLKDEIPVFNRAGWKISDVFLALWDSSLGFYADGNGNIIFDPLQPNFADAIEGFSTWYSEGLVDPEFFTRGPKARDVLLSGNVGGFTFDWASTGTYNEKLADSVPGFRMESIAPVEDQNGNVKMRDYRRPTAGWGISSQCEDPITLIKFMDYIFTEEGSDLFNWGFEDVQYTVNEKGEKHFTDLVRNASPTPLGYLRSLGAQYRVGCNQDSEYEIDLMNDVTKAAAKLYSANSQWYDATMPPLNDNKISLKVMPEDDDNYKKIMASITPYVEEMFQAWTLGTRDFEADYPEFKTELTRRGIDEARAILQKAYSLSYKGK